MKQINVIINAYAVSPNHGSEPGMAWSWIVNLAKHCNLHVITEGEWRAEIDEVLQTLPQKDNLHFYYNPMSEEIRRMCWNQGDWRFYWYYRKWQHKTLAVAKQIIAENHIDVIHQLNMIGFREPGLLWTIDTIPFVWGPVGGMELMNPEYVKSEPLRQRIAMSLKNAINDWQRKHQPNVRKAIARASVVVAATDNVCQFIRRYHKKDAVFINETGCYERPISISNDVNKKEMDILWVGRFIRSKQLAIALNAMLLLKECPSIRLHIIGEGSAEEETLYRNQAKSLGIDRNLIWHGKIPHANVQELMRQGDLFFFPSIMEGTPHVVLEAIQNSLPILCFDVCGQGDVVNDTIGVKVKISTPEEDTRQFANIIKELYNNRDRLQLMSENCAQRQCELSWDVKVRQMVEIYNSCI